MSLGGACSFRVTVHRILAILILRPSSISPCGSSSLPSLTIHTPQQVVFRYRYRYPPPPAPKYSTVQYRSMPPPPPDPGSNRGPGVSARDFHPYDPALRPLSKAQTWPLSIHKNQPTSAISTTNSAPPVLPHRSRGVTTAGGGSGSGNANGSDNGNGNVNTSGNANGSGNGGVAADLAEALRTVARVSQAIPLSEASRQPVVPGAVAAGGVDNQTFQGVQAVQGGVQRDHPMPPSGQGSPLVPATPGVAAPVQGREGEASERNVEVPLDTAGIGEPGEPGAPGGQGSGSSGSTGSSGGSTTNGVTDSISTSPEDITPPSDETREGTGSGSGESRSGSDEGGDNGSRREGPGSSPSSHSTLSSASRKAIIRPIEIGPIKYCESPPLFAATVSLKSTEQKTSWTDCSRSLLGPILLVGEVRRESGFPKDGDPPGTASSHRRSRRPAIYRATRVLPRTVVETSGSMP